MLFTANHSGWSLKISAFSSGMVPFVHQPTVVVVNCLIGILLAMVLAQTWRHLDLKTSGGLVLGGLAATPVGVLALNATDADTLKIIIAIVILCLGLFSLTNIELPLAKRPMSGPVFGFLTSLAVTTLSIGGPLAAIYAIAQKWEPPKVRAVPALFFMSADIAAFGLYSATGLVTRNTLANIGVLLPGLIVGFAISGLIVSRLNERIFRYVVIGVIMVGGSVLLGRELV